MPKIHVIHENDAWVEPLRAAFDELGLPYAEWFLSEGTLDLSEAPPEGVFYNRMSASSHTRDHRYAAELTGGVLAWLEAHGRRVVNDSRALSLEISKIAQYAELSKHGIKTPRPVIEKLNRELNAVLADPVTVEKLATLGIVAVPGTPEALSERMRADLAKYGAVVKAANIKAE